MIKDRSNIKIFLDNAPSNLITRRYIGTIFTNFNNRRNISGIIELVKKMAKQQNIGERTLLLSFSLIERTYTDEYKGIKLEIYILVILNLILSIIDNRGIELFSMTDYRMSLFETITINILIETNGILITHDDILKSENLDISSDIKVVEKLLNYKYLDWHFDSDKIISVILHNRDVLYELKLEDALLVFNKFFYLNLLLDLYSHVYILDSICHFNWRLKGNTIIERRIHPFKIRDDSELDFIDDIEQLVPYKKSIHKLVLFISTPYSS